MTRYQTVSCVNDNTKNHADNFCKNSILDKSLLGESTMFLNNTEFLYKTNNNLLIFKENALKVLKFEVKKIQEWRHAFASYNSSNFS